MLVIKYIKIGRSKFISHLDLLRHFSRTLRRGGIVLELSKGFVPHELMYFAPPCSTGLTSVAEYCTIATNESAEHVFEKFNAVAIEGVQALFVRKTDKNPNLAAKAVYAEYEIPYSETLLDKIASAFLSEKVEIVFDKKGETVSKDVRSMMNSYKLSDDKINVILAVGEKTLRVDRFLNGMGHTSLIGVKKTKLFVGEAGNLVDVDDFVVEDIG